jgi:hypothetical protein
MFPQMVDSSMMVKGKMGNHNRSAAEMDEHENPITESNYSEYTDKKSFLL